ncbi:alpha/beta hydrolase [Rufibacter immobilis]|uniref:alpha/beta hydrolase n=1 Tax=Rufibacter immobilis TaxID=1348778 RepID=UPI0035E73A9C
MGNIIFIHGMFQNPKSWDKWDAYFTDHGYNCLAPSWPLHAGDPAKLRSSPPVDLGKLRLEEIVTEMESLIHDLGTKPIVIGHSVGGLIAQILANRGLIEAGVPISSVAPNGMFDLDWSFFKNSATIANPLKGDEPIYMDANTFHSVFANTLAEEEAKINYQELATHDSRNVFRDCLTAKVDVSKPHVPLLFVSGSEDKIIPADLVRKNAAAYTDPDSITECKIFPNRSHFICGETGWEEVAKHVCKRLKAHGL